MEQARHGDQILTRKRDNSERIVKQRRVSTKVKKDKLRLIEIRSIRYLGFSTSQ
ncbi:hypothetical protein KI387_042203, partial [Taxus chinensis]